MMKIAAERGEKVTSQGMPDFAERFFLQLENAVQVISLSPASLLPKSSSRHIDSQINKNKSSAERDGSSFQAECVQITRRSAAAGSARKTPLAPQEWARSR
jgi:hypothetical protein